MKTLLYFFVLLLIPGVAASQDVLSQNYSDYMDRDDYKVVYVTQRMFSLAAQVAAGADDPELEQAIGRIKGLRSLSSHSSDRASYDELANRVPGNFEELMMSRKGGERTAFWVRTNNNEQVEELLMLEESDQETVLVSIYGLIDLKQLARLAKKMDMGGLEKLEELDDE